MKLSTQLLFIMLLAIFPFKAGAAIISDWGSNIHWPMKYTTTDPGNGWELETYDNVSQSDRQGPIATKGDPNGSDWTPTDVDGNPWTTGQFLPLPINTVIQCIWVYSYFDLSAVENCSYIFEPNIDDSFELYLNGNQVSDDDGDGRYDLTGVVQAGRNTIAIKNTNDAQDYIQVDFKIYTESQDWYEQANGIFCMKALLYSVDPQVAPANNNGKKWYEEGYNDNSWEDVTGPFGRSSLAAGGCLYLRGHAVVNKSTLPFITQMDINVDDRADVYLNGHYVGSNTDFGGFSGSLYIPDSYFIDGDNLLAIYFTDSGGGDAYLNFSFSAADPEELDYTDENGLQYHAVKDGNGVYEFTVTGYEGTSASVSIPDDIRSYPVVAIGEGALGNDVITDVNIPASITSIAENAFVGADLTSITVDAGNSSYSAPGNDCLFDANGNIMAFTHGYQVPATVTNIPHYAFGSTTEVTMGSTTPPTWAYDQDNPYDLSNLTINVPGTIDDFYVYQDAWPWAAMCLMMQSATKDMEVTVSAKATTSDLHDVVGEDNLQFVTSLTLHGTINSYDIMIMRNKMVRLRDLDLSDVSIVYNSYEYYTGYCSQDNLLTSKAFAELEQLQTIKLPRTILGIDADAFADSPNIREVVMQEGLKYISQAFSGTAIEEITIPYSVIRVEDNAFKETAFRKVTFAPQPEGVEEKEEGTTIGNGAFYGCANLEEVTMSEGIVSIGYAAFAFCNHLMEITIPYSVIHVEKAFTYPHEWSIIGYPDYALQNLRKVTFAAKPDGVEPKEEPTTFAESLFWNTPNLQEVNFLGDVVSISASAFKDCPMLNKVVLNDGLLEIGPSAFHNCSSLTQVEIPYSVTVIDEHAFEGSGLQTVRLSAKMDDPEAPELAQLQRIGNSAFQGCSLVDIVLPDRLLYIEDNAFNGNGNLTTVHLPSSVMSIGESAFADCPNIKNYYVKWLVPHRVEMHTFSNYQTSILNVPNEPVTTRDAYYWNTEWSKFLRLNSTYPEGEEPNYEGSLNPIGDDDDGSGTDFVLGDGDRVPGTGDYDIYPRGGMVIEGADNQPIGEMHLKSDGTDGASLIDNGNITVDDLYFDINVDEGMWYFLSFPFNVKLSDITAPGRYVFRYYDSEERANYGSGGWKNLPADQESLEAGKGYIFQCESGEYDEEGNPIGIGILSAKADQPVFDGQQKGLDMNTFISDDVQDASWNLLGNPYPCYYDINQSGYEAPVTVWNGGGYDSYRPGDDNYILRPFEAFFVQKPEGVANIQFPIEGRLTYKQQLEGSSQAPKRRVKASGTREFINLTLSDGEYTDRTRVVFNEDKNVGYDLGDDAAKFISTNMPQFYSLDSDGTRYAINERPFGEVLLGIIVPKTGSYTISAQRMDKPMLMLDKETETLIDLMEGDYQFEAKAGTTNDRFVLVHNSGADGIAQLYSNTGVSLSATEGGLSVRGTGHHRIEIYNANGALVGTLTSDGFAPLQKGVYMVKVNSQAAKVMVK